MKTHIEPTTSEPAAASERDTAQPPSAHVSAGSSTPRMPLQDALVSVVLPVFNEVSVLESLLTRLEDVLEECGCRYEIVFVNDGSTDRSGERLDELAESHPVVRGIGFGHRTWHCAPRPGLPG